MGSAPSEPAGHATPYRITAHHLEVCNCNHGCGCQFAGYPDHGGCRTMIGLELTEGRFGSVDLSGIRSVLAARWPGAIHEGGGHVALFVDERASDEQVNALATIFSGQAGGMPWEAIAGTVAKLDGPERASIEMAVDGRRSSFRIPGVLEVGMMPLLNPVSEEIQDVTIRYPSGGLMWNEGRVGTTETMKISYDGLEFEHPGGFAAYATPTWTNQG